MVVLRGWRPARKQGWNAHLIEDLAHEQLEKLLPDAALRMQGNTSALPPAGHCYSTLSTRALPIACRC